MESNHPNAPARRPRPAEPRNNAWATTAGAAFGPQSGLSSVRKAIVNAIDAEMAKLFRFAQAAKLIRLRGPTNAAK
jgi:hypothetical protein